MKQQRIPLGPVTEPGLAASGAVEFCAPQGLPCGLPACRPMICGNARHREDRPPDSEVVIGGERSPDVWFIRSGMLRLQHYGYDGRRQILSLFLPGEIVGYDGSFREGVSVETVTESGLCRIDRRKFETMLHKDPVLRTELFRQKQEQLDRVHWLTSSLGGLAPEPRLCALLALSSKFMPYQPLPDGTGILSMLLPRKDIADLLATTVESISRIVHKLSEIGVIAIADPAHFRILDLDRLIEIGQIADLFDRMSRGTAKGRSRLGDIVSGDARTPVQFCGR